MTDAEKLEKLKSGFVKLPEEGQRYLLAISEALEFASDAFQAKNQPCGETATPKTTRGKNDERTKQQ